MSAVVARAGDAVARLDRRPVPHRVILWAIPAAVRLLFSPEAAGDLDAIFELRVRSPRGPELERFAIVIRGGSCQVKRGGADDAGAAVTAGADDLVRMVAGTVGWPSLLANGQLLLTGNPFLALRFPGLLALRPTAQPRERTPHWTRGRRTRRSSGSEATS